MVRSFTMPSSSRPLSVASVSSLSSDSTPSRPGSDGWVWLSSGEGRGGLEGWRGALQGPGFLSSQLRGFLKLRTPFEMEIIQDFYNHGATKTWRVLGTFKNNLLLWAPLPSNYLSGRPVLVNKSRNSELPFLPAGCLCFQPLLTSQVSHQGRPVKLPWKLAGPLSCCRIFFEGLVAQAPKKGTRMEQASKHFLHSHCIFCKDSLDVDVFRYWVSSLHVKLVLIIQKEKNVTCSLNIRELLIVLLSSLHSCVFVQAHWVYNPSSYQTRRLLAPATRRQTPRAPQETAPTPVPFAGDSLHAQWRRENCSHIFFFPDSSFCQCLLLKGKSIWKFSI